jgi:alginate O-acetyltransferase complex protein AlgI
MLVWMLAITVVFALSGIWHGAQTTFLVWGLYHAFFIILERVTKAPKAVTKYTTFVVVALGWVYFRAGNMEIAQHIFSQLISPIKFAHLKGLHTEFIASGNLNLAVLFAGVFQLIHSYRHYLLSIINQNTVVRWGIYYLAVLLLLFLSPLANPAFIYFQF